MSDVNAKLDFLAGFTKVRDLGSTEQANRSNEGERVGRQSASCKLADLIILNADPLADLKNCQQVFRVIKGGIVYDPANLPTASKQ